jgi:hypothetical protein
VKHGAWGYRQGCRCGLCRQAKALVNARYKQNCENRRLGVAASVTTPSKGPDHRLSECCNARLDFTTDVLVGYSLEVCTRCGVSRAMRRGAA